MKITGQSFYAGRVFKVRLLLLCKRVSRATAEGKTSMCCILFQTQTRTHISDATCAVACLAVCVFLLDLDSITGLDLFVKSDLGLPAAGRIKQRQ